MNGYEAHKLARAVRKLLKDSGLPSRRNSATREGWEVRLSPTGFPENPYEVAVVSCAGSSSLQRAKTDRFWSTLAPNFELERTHPARFIVLGRAS